MLPSTQSASPNPTTSGQIDGAQSYNGSTDYASAPLDLSGTHVVNVSFWLNWTTNADNDDMALEFTSNLGGTGAFDADINSSLGGVVLIAQRGNVGLNSQKFTRPSAGGWHYYSFTLDTSQAAANETTVYLDGSPIGTLWDNTDNSNNFTNDTLHFMSRNNASLFGTGILDELRVSSTVLSPAWIATEYNNQSSPLSFLTVGTPVASGGDPTQIESASRL